MIARNNNLSIKMSAVEIRIDQSDLSRAMSAMRIWLDDHRFETSSFTCYDSDCGVLIALEFKAIDQAEAFARRFGGRANRLSTGLAAESLDTALSPSGIVG
jgi:hypothetical protein